ncbi:MAG: acetylornithine deacetylase [Planctomycetota bacterium]|jgi:acetylornithine deacetylase
MGAALADIDLLGRLVGFDTVSSNSNLPLAEFVAAYAPEAEVARHLSPDGKKANLILRFGPATGDRSGLVLSGHTDVVPADEEEWQSDPFTLEVGGDRLYGRGTCDMKGFVAVALNVAREARDLRAPLVLVLTYDEEVGTRGARHLVEHWPGADALPRHAIVGEPTELEVVRMHKGLLQMRVTLHGRSAHSAYPHLGKSAIEAMARILVALRGVRHRWEQARGPHAEYFPEVPYVSLSVGKIHGGTAANVVPDRCEIELCVRPLPSMNEQGVVGSVREAVANAAGDAPFEVELTGESPALLLDADAPIHAALCRMTGQREHGGASYATDAGWLARAGLECAVFGPGSVAVAHQPNEYVPKEDLRRARAYLEQMVERFCR